jgi:glycosyltransferase involved in cell wall biosynthesis
VTAAGRSIVCFSSNDWSDIPSSKFHIMRHLGRRNTVLFVDTIGIRHPQLSSRDLGRARERLRKGLAGVRRVETNVFVWSPIAIPYHGVPGVPWVNSVYLARQVRRLANRLGMARPIVWSYLPHAVAAAVRLRPARLLYHCIDDYGAFTDAPTAAFERMERSMLATADLTVVSSKRLYELRRPAARRIAYIPHGVDLGTFQDRSRQRVNLSDLDGLSDPVAGFVGRIADWVDLELIARCARAMPDWSFVLVGPSNLDVGSLETLPNIRVVGRKDHRDIPHYIERFDVCLMPFVRNAVVESKNPLKMYEYLAVGKPVVSVRTAEVERVRDVVRIAEPDDFPQAIREERENDTDARRSARVAAVSHRSWPDVAEEILRLLEGATHGS